MFSLKNLPGLQSPKAASDLPCAIELHGHIEDCGMGRKRSSRITWMPAPRNGNETSPHHGGPIPWFCPPPQCHAAELLTSIPPNNAKPTISNSYTQAQHHAGEVRCPSHGWLIQLSGYPALRLEAGRPLSCCRNCRFRAPACRRSKSPIVRLPYSHSLNQWSKSKRCPGCM